MSNKKNNNLKTETMKELVSNIELFANCENANEVKSAIESSLDNVIESIGSDMSWGDCQTADIELENGDEVHVRISECVKNGESYYIVEVE